MSTDIIYGSGGGGKGGGGGRVASEAPNTLKSTQKAEVIDVISEGEIYGLVDGANSIFIDDVPLSEYSGYSYEVRTGTQDQSATSTSLKGTSNPISRSTSYITYGAANAALISIENSLVKSVIVQISVSGLTYQDMTSGDLSGNYVSFKISTKATGGSYIDKIDTEIRGKCTSVYKQDYLVDLTNYTAANYPITVKIERTKPDATQSNVNDKMYCGMYTEIQPTIFRYPNTALVALTLDSDNFSSIPTRGYEVKGMKIKVPVNYDPNTRAYSGEWNGTFKTAWSDNPAWVFYDLATDTRYGLGNYLSEAELDKWGLYTIAKYCDELVPSGYKNADGSIKYEPRFTCNLYLQSQDEAYKVLTDVASIFRAMQYWASGQLMISADMPKDPVAQFTPSNVIDGLFNYSGSSAKTRHTAAKVVWNDPSDNYRQKVEYVEANGFSSGYNPIDRYGVIQTDLIAIGCTSRGQANRVGRWLLYSELLETEVVTFKTGIEAATIAPGSIIQTTDPFRGGERLGGRVQGTTANGILLDGTVSNGNNYYISLINPEPKVSITASISGTTLTVTAFGSGTSGTLKINTRITGTGIAANTYITGYGTGSGGVGTYYINNSHSIASSSLTALISQPYIETRKGSVNNNEFILDAFAQPFSFTPVENMVWVVSKPTQEPEYWRVVSITEDDPTTASITALEYNPDKFAAIEEGLILEERPVSQINAARPDTPTNLSTQEHLYYSAPSVYSTALSLSWTSNQYKFVIRYCKFINGQLDNNWNVLETFTPNVEIKPIEPGSYKVELEAVNVLGRKSEKLNTTIVVLGVMAPPMDVINFISKKENGILISWTSNTDSVWTYPDIDLDGYEIRELYVSTLNSSSYFLVNVPSSTPLWAASTTYYINDIVKRVVGLDTYYYRCISNHTSGTSFSSEYWCEEVGDIRWKTYSEVKTLLSNPSLSFQQYIDQLNTVWNSLSNNKAESGLIYETSYRDSSATVGYNIFLIKARDKSGNYSNIPSITGNLINKPPAVVNVTYSISGENLDMRWDQPTSDIAISYYEVKYLDNNGVAITLNTQTTYLSKKLWFSGFTEELEIRAFDMSGNASDITNVSIIIPSIGSPINLQKRFIGENYMLTWLPPATGALIPNLSGYEIRTDTNPGSQTNLITTISATSYSSKVNWLNTKQFYVYAIDTVGNYSTYASTSITTPTPSAPTNVNLTVVDNNVLFKWDAPTSGMELPLTGYLLKKGSSWASAEVVGSKTGEFTTVFETVSGTYTYWLAAVNSAGQEGTPVQKSATVNQPPDYVLIDSYYSNFTTPYGDITNNPASAITKVNAFKTLSGELVVPTNTTETWAQHFTSNSKTNIAGFGAVPYLAPGLTSGSYQEIIDYGTIIGASTVSSVFNYTSIYGSPSVSVELYYGTGNPGSIVWSTVVNSDKAFFTDFRYVKIKYTVSGGMVKVNEFGVKIDVKRKSKSGIHSHTVPEVSFSGNISGTTLTINSITAGGPIRIGQVLSATNMSANTTITALGTGTGGIGTYTVSVSQTRAEQAITATDPSGSIVYLTDTGLSNGTRIFTDVQSITVTPAYNASAQPIAIYNFVDSATPTYFKILLYDSNTGDRIGGTCSYTVTGV